MFIMPLPIVMLVSPEQFSKAEGLMFVTGLELYIEGITISVSVQVPIPVTV